MILARQQRRTPPARSAEQPAAPQARGETPIGYEPGAIATLDLPERVVTLRAAEIDRVDADAEDRLDEESRDSLGLPLFLSARMAEMLGAPAPDAEALAAPDQPAPADAQTVEAAGIPTVEDRPEEDQAAAASADVEPAAAAGAAAAGIEVAAGPEPAPEEAAAALAPAEPGATDAHALLAQWQSGVRSEAAAIPRPTLGAAGAPAGIAAAGRAAGGAHAARRQAIPQQAGSVLPPLQQVERPPAPPAGNPIVEYTQRIEAASSGSQRSLPDHDLPPLATRKGGTPPHLGTTPVNPRIFQLLITPSRLEIAAIPSDATNPDRRLLDAAIREFHQQIAPTPTGEASVAVAIQNRGAPQIKPLPAAQGIDVGRVVARLLADPGPAAERVMRQLKQTAYPHAVLLNEQRFSNIGQAWLPALQGEMAEELQRIATAAGVSKAALAGMVAERQRALEEQRSQTSLDISSAAFEAGICVSQEGGRTLGAIAGVRQQLDEEALQRQEAASGGTDPSVIEARRQQIVDWARERVTTEITNFQRQGDAREQALEQAFRQQENAYTYVAQRDEYRLLNEPTPLSQRPAEEQQRLQDQALDIRSFARDHIQIARSQTEGFKASDAKIINDWRTTVETAGTDAIHAARDWADRRIDESRGWWERIVERVRGWFTRAHEETIRWEARTTQETRDFIADDLRYVAELEQPEHAGATRESLLANERLTAEQRAIVEAYFAPNADRSPLALIAARLETQIALARRAQARGQFEQELLVPGTSWDTLNLVGAAERPGFDAASVASGVHDAVAGLGTNEAKVYSSLAGLTAIQAAAVRRNYEARFGESLDAALRGDLSGDELARAQLLLSGDQQAADAYALHYAVDQWGTDEETIMSVLRNQTPEQRRRTIAYYNAHFTPPLREALKDDLSGHDLYRALALMEGKIADADAIAIDDAMRGGFLWGAGTDEAQIQGVYRQIRDEVLAQAQREGWSSAQMEAEVRRRNRELETAFGKLYGEAYRAPGHESESALRHAFRTELSGPELDLANALQDNDMARAAAARIEVERRSVYADDDAINNVLRSQYERSLEAVQLDEGPERREKIRRALELWQREHPHASANDLSREQMRLERETERAIERSAQARSHIAMSELERVYGEQYRGRSFRVTLEMNMSGDELRRARLLVERGGHLTPYQELDFATRGAGTDEERLRETLRGRTRAEILEIRVEWERRHPGESFESFLRGELSGRDESEIMDTVEHGAPESAFQRAAQLRRHAEYELDHGAWLGGAVAADEADYLRAEMQRLDHAAGQLRHTGLSDEERDRILFEFQTQAAVADDAIQEHQRAIDRTTDTATQVVGIVAGVLATVLTGGALGAVAVALIAAAASTLSTMATKFLLKGADYGIEDFGTDMAVGVVDAVAAAATAGVGSAIVGRFLRGAGGAAAHAAENVAVRTASTGGNRATQTLEREGARIARLTGRARLNQIPAMNRFTEAQGLIGGGRAVASTAEAAGEPAVRKATMSATRALSKIMTESLDNLIQSAPSAFAASIINDENWHGNVLLNILGGAGEQIGQGMVMGSAMMGAHRAGAGAMHLGRAGVGFAGERLRMHTPEGRWAEGSRRLGAAYIDHVAEHPAASYGDFLHSDTGTRLRAELSERGMLPTRVDIEAELPRSHDVDTAPGPRMAQEAPGRPAPEPAPRAPVEPEARARAADESRMAPARILERDIAAAPGTGGTIEPSPPRAGGRERAGEAAPAETRPNLREGEARAGAAREGATGEQPIASVGPEREAAPGPRSVESEQGPHAGEARATPAEPRRAPADVEAGTRAAEGEPRPARAPEPARPAPEGGAVEMPAAHAADSETTALRDALPERMRESVAVERRADLPEGEVRVVPVREGGRLVDGKLVGERVVGVRIEAGPGATATDVMLHAHVVQGYQRYMGLLGRARELIERFNAWLRHQEHAGVGITAFEARLEVAKLPAIIEERMARLERGGLDPAAQARLLDDINSLHRQIEYHAARLNDFSEGRGYVAVEGLPSIGESAQARPTDWEAIASRYDADASALRATASASETEAARLRETGNLNEAEIAASRAKSAREAVDLAEGNAWEAIAGRYHAEANTSRAGAQEARAEATRLQEAGRNTEAAEATARALAADAVVARAEADAKGAHDEGLRLRSGKEGLIAEQLRNRAELEAERATLGPDVEQRSRSRTKAREQFDEAKTTIRELKEKIGSFEGNLKDINARLKSGDGVPTELYRQKDVTHEKLKNLRRELESAQRRGVGRERNYNEAQSSYDEVWRRFQQISRQLDDLANLERGLSEGDSKAKGIFGEAKADDFMASQGYDKIGGHGSTPQGIDGIYRDRATGEYIIGEAKYGTSQLAWTEDGLQLSITWTERRIDAAVLEGRSPTEAIELARDIRAKGYKRWVLRYDPMRRRVTIEPQP